MQRTIPLHAFLESHENLASLRPHHCSLPKRQIDVATCMASWPSEASDDGPTNT
ncbi:hypothetical protein QO004_003628 [Rhizobium mesoamericanum]|nr:hypothetical protein [Rhizobium mesoamericanum]